MNTGTMRKRSYSFLVEERERNNNNNTNNNNNSNDFPLVSIVTTNQGKSGNNDKNNRRKSSPQTIHRKRTTETIFPFYQGLDPSLGGTTGIIYHLLHNKANIRNNNNNEREEDSSPIVRVSCSSVARGRVEGFIASENTYIWTRNEPYSW